MRPAALQTMQLIPRRMMSCRQAAWPSLPATAAAAAAAHCSLPRHSLHLPGLQS